ncbi:MAG: pyridoxal phosphate-dependent aminotransferase [Acidimicrobiia bacterium]
MRSWKTPLVSRMQPFGTTIFTEMSALAVAHDAINLGQGFPDRDGPPEVTEAAIAAIRDGHNQYPPLPGIPAARAAIAEHQRRFWGLDYEPDGEVQVTAGATEALTAAVLALCEPGDEIVVFEPAYDSYPAAAALAGAALRRVTLRDPRFGFDADEVRAAFGPRTRLLLLNSPHNPTGKVFEATELGLLAELCVAHDVIAVTDEVYEHLVFDGRHMPLATFPGMRERTVTISSLGKTFSCTGWKIGWACGPAELITALRTVKQFLTFSGGAPFQEAIAPALALPDTVYAGLATSLGARRDLLASGLAAAGYEVLPSAATYFLNVDIRSVGEQDGVAFCRALPERCGVAAVPTSVFYDDPQRALHLVRFAFCKQADILEEAVRRLRDGRA